MFLPTFIINWTSEMTTEMLGNVEGVITDMSPLLVPIIGIGIGLIVIGSIITAIRGR